MERVAPISSFRLISPPLGVMVSCLEGEGSNSLLGYTNELAVTILVLRVAKVMCMSFSVCETIYHMLAHTISNN